MVWKTSSMKVSLINRDIAICCDKFIKLCDALRFGEVD